MAPRAFVFAFAFALFLLASAMDAVLVAPSMPPAPPPHAIGVTNSTKCPEVCTGRCELHSRKNVCMRACNSCCVKCKCVPSGTYGNRELCGTCYTDTLTHRNATKCP
ncbi:Gibberellin-regulated protein 14 [Acorus calamus]|uniref:Gibberellin-regulated protein 14 n=1 Tax=Acorus calamus TaxID=4465 RepID=A0AAV9E9M4_ACOCL|nr:Gibberellin-regulated protein 14 [Acorus calamus]